MSKSSNHKLNIILLKTNDQITSNSEFNNKNPNDRYAEFIIKNFNKTQLDSIEQINLLKFDFCNLNKLKDCLLNSTCFLNPTKNDSNYKCLILTSRQTCEAIEKSLSDVLYNEKELVAIDSNLISNEFDNEKLTIYCVGQVTANSFKQIVNRLRLINSKIDSLISIRTTEHLSLNNEHKQNGKQLVKLIINDFKTLSSHNFDKYALYPCSSIRKDDISNELNNQKIKFDELTVYKTINCEKGLDILRKRLKNLLNEESRVICLVFFSPSACDAVFSSLNKDLILNNLDKYKLLSIGPSTTEKLKSLLNNNTKSVEIYQLDEPSPESLFNKLNLFI